MALVLTGNLKIGTTTGVDETDEAAATEMGPEVISFKIQAIVNTIEVPATMTAPIHGRGGAADYSITIGYLSNDIASSLFSALYAGLTNTTKTLYFEGSMRTGAITAANPEWSGVFVVTEASVGGVAAGLSQATATFPLTGPPTKAVV